MKKNILAVAISAAVVSPSFAQENINPFADEKSGFYLGLGAGAANYDDAYQPAQNAYDKSNADYTSLKYTKRDGLLKLFGGYRVNKYFSVELDYLNFADTEAELNRTYGSHKDVRKAENEINAYGLKAIGIYPINNHFDLYASAGLRKWKVKEDFTVREGSDFTKVSRSEKGTSAVYGLGANYNITDNFTVGLQWERMNDVGDKKKLAFGETDIDLYTASFQYNF